MVFKTGIIVGRFEHIHIGHEKLINIGLSLCDKLLIFVGSANEISTKRNPFDADYRISLISKIYKDEVISGRIILKPLNDFENKEEISPKWGKYVLNEAKKYIDTSIDCIIYGKDKDIFKCFDKETVKNITEIIVDRNTLLISATKIREFLANNDKENWKKYVNEKIYDEYNNLRGILLQVYCNTN